MKRSVSILSASYNGSYQVIRDLNSEVDRRGIERAKISVISLFSDLRKAQLFDYDRTMDTNELLKLFKALSSEHRLKLFLLLNEWCCGEFSLEKGIERCFTKACAELNLSRSTISHHFKELQKAGLITCTRNGQSYVCQINQEAVRHIQHFLKS